MRLFADACTSLDSVPPTTSSKPTVVLVGCRNQNRSKKESLHRMYKHQNGFVQELDRKLVVLKKLLVKICAL